MKYLAAFFLALVLACGCERAPIKGSVTAKRFDPAYSTTYFHNVFNTETNRFQWENTPSDLPDIWWLYITNSQTVYKVRVSKERFDSTKVGDQFNERHKAEKE